MHYIPSRNPAFDQNPLFAGLLLSDMRCLRLRFIGGQLQNYIRRCKPISRVVSKVVMTYEDNRDLVTWLRGTSGKRWASLTYFDQFMSCRLFQDDTMLCFGRGETIDEALTNLCVTARAEVVGFGK